jgi:S1-C subfamily serine protease
MVDRTELTKLAEALGGLPVLACRPGSPADQAGVRYGDIVLQVNGVATPDWAAFIEGRSRNNHRMQIRVFRDGSEHELSLSLTPSSPIDAPTLLAEILAERIVPLPDLMALPPKESEPN